MSREQPQFLVKLFKEAFLEFPVYSLIKKLWEDPADLPKLSCLHWVMSGLISNVFEGGGGGGVTLFALFRHLHDNVRMLHGYPRTSLSLRP